MNRCVVHDVGVVCHLHENLKTYRSFGDPVGQFLKEIVRVPSLQRGVIQVFVPGIRYDSVMPWRLTPSLSIKRIAVTPKYDSLAKLEGTGLGRWTNASAFG